MSKLFLRSAYNYDRNEASRSSGLECRDDHLTKQAFEVESNINTIAQRFRLTGELPRQVRMPTFGDFSQVHDFQSAVDAIAKAREAFEEMPSKVRDRFRNDPQAFVAFCSDEANRAEAISLGLVPQDRVEAAVAASRASVLSGTQPGPGSPAGDPGK